jgi:tetratricopeptide (TPR) repeat protein
MAVSGFIEASRADPGFALARYRLGVAFQEIGEPSAAAEAFRGSIRAERRFVAGHLALSTVLYYHGRLASRGWRGEAQPLFGPAEDLADREGSGTAMIAQMEDVDDVTAVEDAFLPSFQSEESVEGVRMFRSRFRRRLLEAAQDRTARRDESRALLIDVLRNDDASPGQQALAFYGLCRHALDADEFGRGPDDGVRYLAYYFCSRSLYLYQPLVVTGLDAGRVSGARAVVLDALGDVLSIRPRRSEASKSGDWNCGRSVVRSPYTQPAGLYYGQAEALLPNSRIIRCNSATMALALGDEGKVRALSRSSGAHVGIAQDYASRGRYVLALEEYERAIELDPDRNDALLGYASMFWAWRLSQNGRGFDDATAEKAESYAMRAIRVGLKGVSTTDQRLAHAALGKVLLVQARVAESVDELRVALQASPEHGEGEAPHTPVFDEIRWALAQAYLCAEVSGVRVEKGDQRAAAAKLLERIRDNERLYERRAFTDRPALLDPSRHQRACLLTDIASRSAGGAPPFGLAEEDGISYSGYSGMSRPVLNLRTE